MILQEDQISVLKDGAGTLLDGMIQQDAIPFLMYGDTPPVIDPNSTDDDPSIIQQGKKLTTVYLSSPTISDAVKLQYELNRIFELISPRRACQCESEYEILELNLYGDGTQENAGWLFSMGQVDLYMRDAEESFAQVLTIYGYTTEQEAQANLEECINLRNLDGQTEQLTIYYDRQIENAVNFLTQYKRQHGSLETLKVQKDQLGKKIKATQKTIDTWPKNSIPHERTPAKNTETCARCKKMIPVPLEEIYTDEHQLDAVSAILFEQPWADVKDDIPLSMVDVIFAASYTWGFKPLEGVDDPFAKNMQEVMGTINKRRRVPRWVRMIQQQPTNGNTSDSTND